MPFHVDLRTEIRIVQKQEKNAKVCHTSVALHDFDCHLGQATFTMICSTVWHCHFIDTVIYAGMELEVLTRRDYVRVKSAKITLA